MFSSPKFWFALVLGIVVVLYGVLKVMVLAAKAPERDGSQRVLAACPDSPNCVCSEEARDSHAIAPIPFRGDASAAWARLSAVLEQLGGKAVRSGDQYLWFEFRSLLVGFVDDVECRLNRERQQIEIRSASRVGYSDLGANRRRVEAIRAAFGADSTASTAPAPPRE